MNATRTLALPIPIIDHFPVAVHVFFWQTTAARHAHKGTGEPKQNPEEKGKGGWQHGKKEKGTEKGGAQDSTRRGVLRSGRRTKKRTNCSTKRGASGILPKSTVIHENRLFYRNLGLKTTKIRPQFSLRGILVFGARISLPLRRNSKETIDERKT